MEKIQTQKDQTKKSFVLAMIFFGLLAVVVVWLYSIRMSLVKIDEKLQINSATNSEQAVSEWQQAVQNLGAAFEAADEAERLKAQQQADLISENDQTLDREQTTETGSQSSIEAVAKSVADKMTEEAVK
ncbi:TPA: hypothetical protein DF272_04445 [Candidatus Falkowbacteria bacterium]|nr:hypothetical protein [Candidatus Falkowbacteria bacterium]